MLNTDDTEEHRSKTNTDLMQGQIRDGFNAQMMTEERPVCGKYDDLTQKIIGVFYDVYNELGFGFLESVYCESMRLALSQAGLKVQAEVQIPVRFRGELVGVFRADLIVNDVVLIELKACESLTREHESQTLHYLRATDIEVALLMNFGPSPKLKRLVIDNEIKQTREKSVSSVTIGVKHFALAEVIE